MCGYVGFLDIRNDKSEDFLTATVCRMRDALSHRGPDDFGCWVDPKCGIAFGHRRLSVIDIASTGGQPMQSTCGRYVLAYNGEIYNFEEIRDLLNDLNASITWRGHSDTEVLLESLVHLGVKETLCAIVGMFSFAFFDKAKRKLYLCRDRAGEKPLYYGFAGGVFLFGSELKALELHPDWFFTIDKNGLSRYLKYGYVPAPYSIYENIYKLDPGCYIELDIKQLGDLRDINQHKSSYWSIRQIINGEGSCKGDMDEHESIDELEVLLKNAIKNQMISDVPLGAFLSGGVDSSTVVALMQSMSGKPIRTFTIGFREKEFDESRNAKEVADFLGTEHTEFLVTEQESLAVIPKLPWIYDEPFSDSSQIPTLLLSMITRDHVTVSLSGDGGDELFSGYNRYLLAHSIWKKFGGLNMSSRKFISELIRRSPDMVLDNLFTIFSRQIFRYGREGSISHKLKKFSELLKSQDKSDLYQRMISINQHPNALLKDAYKTHEIVMFNNHPDLVDYIDCMMFFDQMTYLPDDILVKLDRAAMSVSLETRVPLLDHRILEFAWQIPQKLKIRDGQGKWLLRKVLERHLPKHMIERPKRGLGVPLRTWLKGELREWAESLLAEEALERGSVFCQKTVRNKWAGHLSGKAHCEGMLWNILMFQAWLEHKKA